MDLVHNGTRKWPVHNPYAAGPLSQDVTSSFGNRDFNVLASTSFMTERGLVF